MEKIKSFFEYDYPQNDISYVENNGIGGYPTYKENIQEIKKFLKIIEKHDWEDPACPLKARATLHDKLNTVYRILRFDIIRDCISEFSIECDVEMTIIDIKKV